MLRQSTVAELPPDALKRLAGDFEDTARDLRLRAAELYVRARMRKDTERQLNALWRTPTVVQGFLTMGFSFDMAVLATLRSTGIPIETILAHWRRHRRETKDRAGLARDLKILRLARSGKSNHHIAARLAPTLHPGSISRILRRLILAAAAQARADDSLIPTI